VWTGDIDASMTQRPKKTIQNLTRAMPIRRYAKATQRPALHMATSHQTMHIHGVFDLQPAITRNQINNSALIGFDLDTFSP